MNLSLPTHGLARSNLLVARETCTSELSAELPEILSWLEASRRCGARADVLMLNCWGRKPGAPTQNPEGGDGFPDIIAPRR